MRARRRSLRSPRARAQLLRERGAPEAAASGSSASAWPIAAEQPLRQVRAHRCERRRACLDRRRPSRAARTPRTVPAGERLPEQDADRPDVVRRAASSPAGARARCTRASRARRRPRSASRPRRTARARSRAGAPRCPSSVLEQHVRRLHVPVDDPAAVRVREPVEDLRAASTAAPSPARPRASPRAASGRGRTRRRCRRGRRRGRSRMRAGSARGGGAAAASASRSARSAALPSRGTILSATSSPVRSSRASQTEPEPPLPSGRSGR